MDPFDKAKTEAVWRRVRGQVDSIPAFFTLAEEEIAIAKLCSRLYSKGIYQPLMRKLYQQANSRAAQLQGLGKMAGEQRRESRIREGEGLEALLNRLSTQSRRYDPNHPAYGPLFAQFRSSCVWGQQQLLHRIGQTKPAPKSK